MTPERHRQIGELYHAALAVTPEACTAFLETASGSDAELLREVQSLLTAHGDAGSFIAAPALAVAMPSLAGTGASSLVGRQLGPYTIQAPLGAGGMGEVYRARDSKLGRDVAIKILPRVFTTDPDRRARFDREARVLASLNHPHIGAIYGLEALDGTPALILELVEGDTLAERITTGPISISEALNIARQIADALDAAHERGITHRDLKPANIKITPGGIVKVLDFGLAKAATSDASGPDLTQSPTVASRATREGVILGTPAYMSPEQARGKPVDKRTDIWAFACVVYEMLTGRVAFPGDTLSDTIASILQGEPDWRAISETTPAAIRRLLRRCVEKDPTRRLRDIGDARIEIEDVLNSVSPSPAATTSVASVQRFVRLPWTVAALASLVAIVAASALTWYVRTTPPIQTGRISRTTIAASGTASVLPSAGRSLAITPDGTRIVYQGNNGRLFVRGLDQLDPIAVTTATAPLNWVFVSPDGRWIGFDEGGSLKKVALTGGPAMTIFNTDTGGSSGATWAPDDTIIFATSDPAIGLQRVSADGGNAIMLTRPVQAHGELDHLWPEMLPGGRAVLFTITAATGGLDAAQVALLDLGTNTYRVLIRGGSDAHYVPSGHLVYTAGGTLLAVGFDLNRLVTRGPPVTVLPRLVRKSQGAGDFDVGANGTLAYVDAPDFGADENTLVWADRQGREVPLGVPRQTYRHPRVSQDGLRVAVGTSNFISVLDLARQKLSQVTFDPANGQSPVWTSDGRRLLFYSGGLFWQAADGTGAAEKLADGLPSGVTPNGEQVLFNSVPGSRDVMVLTLRTHHVDPLVQTPATERNGVVSPDGHWLAYESDSSGRFEIYVRPFPNVNAGIWPISTAGGKRPLWAPKNGQELFWVALDGALMAVRLDARGATWSAGSPAKVLEGRYATGDPLSARNYDVSPDGQRFLMVKQSANQDAAPKIVVVQNWLEELKRLVSIP